MTDAPPPPPPPHGRVEPEELHRLRKQLQDAARMLEVRERELAIMRNSRSFRLTAPLRWLRRRLSGAAHSEATLDSVLAGNDQLPLAIRSFPSRMVHQESPERPNDSHRPLNLDDALQPLLAVDVADGALREAVSPLALRYYGDQSRPLRVATVASQELRQELSFDAAVLPLHADLWKEQLGAGSLDVLLVEGIWEPEGGWGAGFGGSPASQRRLQPLLDHCRENAIPTVLWAREDPDQLERLRWLFPRVERVYAVDDPGQQWLQRNFPDLGAGVLPVAIQPALYNPIRSYGLKDCRPALAGTALFDGWWALSSELRADPLLLALGDRLRVVDTDGDYSWVRLRDGGRYASLALGSMTPLEKSALLRSGSAEVFLADSTASSWRQANRMLRAAASGAPVLVSGQQVRPWAGRGREVSPGSVTRCLDVLDPARPDRAREAHVAFREILTSHCLADRLAVVARDLGIRKGPASDPLRVAHLLVTMRPELLESCLDRFRADVYADKELLVVLHGDGVDTAAARALVRQGEPVRILQAPAARSLGDCLNMAIAHTDAPFWMKLDDDDHYGPAYTRDMMLYRRVIRTPLMGKPPAFVHLGGRGEVRWSPEWASHANLLHHPPEASAALVAGGTLAGTRQVLEAVGFSGSRRGGSDSEFIERCLGQGHRLLATDAFNFVRYRNAVPDFHTWKVADDELRRGTVLLGTQEALCSQAFI